MDYFEEIPGEYPKDREAVDFARRRFQIYLEKVWPEMERLTREDLADERHAELKKAINGGLSSAKKAPAAKRTAKD